MAKKNIPNTLEVANCDLKNDKIEVVTSYDQLNVNYIRSHIYTIRGVEIMLDTDLATMYGVETKQLKRQVKRNIERFPDDFMFELTQDEYKSLRCQNGTI